MIDRALIVGLGSIGKRHLRLLRVALPGADIRVLRHSSCEGEIEFADGCFDCLETACAFAPEIALIASPAPFHLSTAMALAKSGTHLMIEKPISDETSGIAELISLCSKRGLTLQVGYNLRFLKTLQAFRAELARNTIGQIYSVRCEIGQYLPSWRPEEDYRTTVSACRNLGGGVLLELSHELDLLRWLFGDVYWLSAWIGNQSDLEINVEDSAMLQLGYSDGIVAQLCMDFIRHDTTRCCTVIGAAGSLCWDAVAGQVTHFDSDTGDWSELFSAKDQRDFSYTAQIDAFLSAVQTGQPSAIAAQGTDGLAVMKLIDAAHRSDASEGRRIVLGAQS